MIRGPRTAGSEVDQIGEPRPSVMDRVKGTLFLLSFQFVMRLVGLLLYLVDQIGDLPPRPRFE